MATFGTFIWKLFYRLALLTITKWRCYKLKRTGRKNKSVSLGLVLGQLGLESASLHLFLLLLVLHLLRVLFFVRQSFLLPFIKT